MTWLRPSLKAVIGALAVVLVLQVAFHVAAAPNLRITKLVFTGDRPRVDAGLGAVLGLRDREYYFSVDEARVKQRLTSLPWVRDAQVTKRFPDTLAVELRVRRPLAISLVGGAVLVIDNQGLVYEVRTDARGLDLPVISGVTFEALRVGARFPEALAPLFERLEALRSQAPALYRQISEVQLRRNDRGSFDAVVYPQGTPVRVVLGDRWDQGTIQQMFVLLDVVRRQGWTAKTAEIDFRATPVVFRPRES